MLHILTLTWNGCEKLIKLKESLLSALKDIDYTWWIKDNGSVDDTVKIASAWGDKVKVVAYPDNKQNFSQGMNYIFHRANPKDEDLVLFLNNDVIFGDDTSLKKMIEIMKDPNVGVVGARLLFTNTEQLQHAGVVFLPSYHFPVHFRSGEKSDENAELNRFFQVVTGAVLLTKGKYFREAYKNVNGVLGMDENYHWAFDDVDFCLSVGINLKKKIVYCGKTKIFHEESATLKKHPVNRMFLHHNLNYFKDKWLGKYNIDQTAYGLNPKHNLYKQG